MDLHIDPELQAVIPPPTDQERTQLEANLLADGCRDPLVVWAGEPPAQVCPSCRPGTPFTRATPLIEAHEGSVVWLCGFCDHGEPRPWILLDGHTRYAICQAHEIPFSITEAPSWVRTRGDAKVWMIQNQLARRNLEAYQWAELALTLEPLIAAKAKAHQQQAGGAVPQKLAEAVDTRETLAQVAQVSHETMRKAKVIAQAADEPTKEALRRGKRTIHGVYKDLRRPRTAANRKTAIEASSGPTIPGAHGPGETLEETLHDGQLAGDPRFSMARRLIELADTSLQVLANWRRRFPEDLSVQAFGLMEKHLHDLKSYFQKKKGEMSERSASVEVAARDREMGQGRLSEHGASQAASPHAVGNALREEGPAASQHTGDRSRVARGETKGATPSQADGAGRDQLSRDRPKTVRGRVRAMEAEGLDEVQIAQRLNAEEGGRQWNAGAIRALLRANAS